MSETSSTVGLRFLHASDIHLLDLTGVGPLRYFNKRATGGLNLLLGRRKRHDEDRFDALVEASRRLGVDRLVLTGDLTNLALESEFEHVARRLSSLPLPVTVIPGNHDTYTRGSARARRFERYLGGFMEGERLSDAPYPFVQDYGDVALVGVSSAVPTRPLWATGRVGPDQLTRLAEVLRRLRGEGKMRVVLIHHPVMEGVARPRHELVDLDAFGRVIAREGAELVLHGHEHKVVRGHIEGPEGPVPVHGISSGTAVAAAAPYAAGFTVYEIEGGTMRSELHLWQDTDFARADARLAVSPVAAP